MTYGRERCGDGAAVAAWLQEYADGDGPTVTTVLNGHDSGIAGWGDHRAVLTLKKSPQWLLWARSDRKNMGQLAFANLVHDGLDDIVEPSGADMLELAQTLQVNSKVAFRSQQLLTNGQRQFTYEGLDPRGCTICLHGPTRPEPVTVEATFPARHDGQCPACNLPIRADQMISRLSTGAYVHKWCRP